MDLTVRLRNNQRTLMMQRQQQMQQQQQHQQQQQQLGNANNQQVHLSPPSQMGPPNGFPDGSANQVRPYIHISFLRSGHRKACPDVLLNPPLAGAYAK